MFLLLQIKLFHLSTEKAAGGIWHKPDAPIASNFNIRPDFHTVTESEYTTLPSELTVARNP